MKSRITADEEVVMNYVTRTVSLIKIAFHSNRIRQYRQQGRTLMRSLGQPALPQLIRLTHQIDHHGYLLFQLEREFAEQ